MDFHRSTSERRKEGAPLELKKLEEGWEKLRSTTVAGWSQEPRRLASSSWEAPWSNKVWSATGETAGEARIQLHNSTRAAVADWPHAGDKRQEAKIRLS